MSGFRMVRCWNGHVDHSKSGHVRLSDPHCTEHGYSDPHCKFLFQVYDKLKLVAQESNKLADFVTTQKLMLDQKNILRNVKPSERKVKSSKGSKDRTNKQWYHCGKSQQSSKGLYVYHMVIFVQKNMLISFPFFSSNVLYCYC